MNETKIVVEISEDGALTLDATGFEGDACLRQLEALLEGLASAPETVVRKQGEPSQQTVRQHQPIGGKK